MKQKDVFSKELVDKKIKNDLETYLNSKCLDQIENFKKEFEFWAFALIFLKDEKFDSNEQLLISELFSQEKLEKLKSFIGSFSKEEVIINLSRNCIESFNLFFNEAPTSSISCLMSLDKSLEEKINISNGTSFLLSKCPDLKRYLESS